MFLFLHLKLIFLTNDIYGIIINSIVEETDK